MLTELSVVVQGMLAFSFVMAAQIGLVLLLRKPVARKLGAVACYRLWLLPVLWLPLYWLGPMLLEALSKLLSATAYSATSYYVPLQQFRHFELLPFVLPNEVQTLATKNLASSYAWPALGLLWITGTVVILAWQSFRWFWFLRHVNSLAAAPPTLELENSCAAAHFDSTVPVLCLNGMRSVALFGVFKPVLLLPDSFCQRYDNNQRHIILAHEAVHLRRRDNGWNLCALLLLALFWTNPLILLAWRYYRLDQELSCDALALAHCNGEQQKRYARTLLDSLESLSANNSQPALSAWDDLRDLKERSLMIKHHLVTNTRRSTMLCTLMLLALLGGSVTITFAELANAAEPAETQITRIMELLNQGDSEGARAELEPLLQAGEAGDLNTDQYLRALHISSGLHIKAKNYSKARDDLETSLQLPNLPQETVIMINYAIGQSYIVSEDWPQAIVYISRYLAMTDGDKPGPLYLIAVAHYQQKQYVEATSYMERLFALPEQDFQESWYALLNALYAQTEQWDKAREVNEKMVELFDNPDDEKRLEMLNSGDAENI